jgi:hypothetical protein
MVRNDVTSKTVAQLHKDSDPIFSFFLLMLNRLCFLEIVLHDTPSVTVSWGSSVSTVSGYRLDDWVIEV